MAIDLEDVLTEAQLVEALGATDVNGSALRPRGWDSLEPARRTALELALQHLTARTPPIREADLAVPAELRPAVLQAAKMQLYELAMTTAQEGSVWHAKWEMARALFRDTIKGLTPTLTGGLRGPARSFSFSRR